MSKIIHGDLKFVLAQDDKQYKMCFADPPDNINLQYLGYKDRLPTAKYVALLQEWLDLCIQRAEIVWWSFNAIWTPEMGRITETLLEKYKDLSFKPCQQFYTFGQDNQYDLKTCHRPIYRYKRVGAQLYPDAIRVPSWRLRNGDKRANPAGCVPADVFDLEFEDAAREICEQQGGAKKSPLAYDQIITILKTHFAGNSDVFFETRVVGNNEQKRDWVKTQLNESLVERAVKMAIDPLEGEEALDAFSGSGTMQRVCRRLGVECTSIEVCGDSCRYIAQENNLEIEEFEL